MRHSGSMSASALRWRILAGFAALTNVGLGAAWIVRPRLEIGGRELVEGWALLAVLCASAAFALLSFTRRPVLLLVGAVAAAVTSPLLGTLLPVMWIFSAIYAVAFVRQPPQRSFVPSWGLAALPVLLVLGVGTMILGATEMTCVTTVVGGRTQVECGETTTTTGSITALALVGVVVAGGFGLATARRPNRPSTVV